MIPYIKLYHFYTSALVRALRLLVFGSIIFLLYTAFPQGRFVLDAARQPLALLCLFFMVEIFFNYKVRRIPPTTQIGQNTGDSTLSMSRPLASAYVLHASIEAMMHALLRNNQVQFLLERITIAMNELVVVDIQKEDVLQKAAELAKTANGTFVTTMDYIAAYLL